MAETPPEKISREDLEKKFRAVKGDVDKRALSAKQTAKPYAIGAAILMILLTYMIGKRVGKKKSTVVQIRRI